jgi:hypothetical protein
MVILKETSFVTCSVAIGDMGGMLRLMALLTFLLILAQEGIGLLWHFFLPLYSPQTILSQFLAQSQRRPSLCGEVDHSFQGAQFCQGTCGSNCLNIPGTIILRWHRGGLLQLAEQYDNQDCVHIYLHRCTILQLDTATQK